MMQREAVGGTGQFANCRQGVGSVGAGRVSSMVQFTALTFRGFHTLDYLENTHLDYLEDRFLLFRRLGHLVCRHIERFWSTGRK